MNKQAIAGQKVIEVKRREEERKNTKEIRGKSLIPVVSLERWVHFRFAPYTRVRGTREST